VAPGILPLQAAGADLEAAAPVLTGKPADGAAGLIEQSDLQRELEGITDGELLTRMAREICISSIILSKEMARQAAMLVRTKPREIGVLSLAITRCSEAAALVLTRSHTEIDSAQRLIQGDVDAHPLAKSIEAWRAAAAGASRS
jgi:ribonuclease HII